METQRIVLAVLFIIAVPAACHLLFSHLGFNPTDDGWILAGSRRVLDGQVPHRDFISIRPAGSHLLHAPLLLLCGNQVLWISRYVAWLQLACIAVAWVVILDGSVQRRLSPVEWFVFALIAFCFSAHIFPVMPWHTIDGLFFASLGVMLAWTKSGGQRLAGFLLVGMAPLFRQNFAFLIPGTLIATGAWRRKLAWGFACLPTGSYIAYLAANGAIADAVMQLTSYGLGDLVRRGFAVYVLNAGFPVGLLLGFLGAYLQPGGHSRNEAGSPFAGTMAQPIAQLTFTLVPISVILSLLYGGMLFTREPSYGLFGAVAGAALFRWARKSWQPPYLTADVLALLLAWAASLSTGYNTPALASGPLVLFLAVASREKPDSPDLPGRKISTSPRPLREWHGVSSTTNLPKRCPSRALLLALVAATLVSFAAARTEYIYNEKPARYLTWDLGDVLAGGKNIKTDNNTYAVLRDFQVARRIAKGAGHIYCVIPDLSVIWVRGPEPNPLSIDWPQETELRKPRLVERVEGELESLKGDLVIIVQKFRADTLASGVAPLPQQHSPLVPYVISHFVKMAETAYFELYK